MAGRGPKGGRNGKGGGLRAGQSKPGQVTHGLSALRTLLKQRKLDGRSMLGQLLRQRRREFETNYGDLSAPKAVILDRALFKITWLDHVERWALTHPNAVGMDGGLSPVLATYYIGWSESLRRDLLALGLERTAREINPDEAIAMKIAASKARQGGEATDA